MTLTELKYIVAVARHKHFGKAAKAYFDVRDIFLNNKDFFKNIIYQYIETKQNN